MTTCYALRLKPGQDLKQSLKMFAQEHQIQAGFIITAIGSLQQAKLRFADQPDSTELKDKFEILALNGTLSVHGMHLHMMLGDRTGATLGGHLDYGCLIYTTAEIVIGTQNHWIFRREPDEATGFLELKITALNNS